MNRMNLIRHRLFFSAHQQRWVTGDTLYDSQGKRNSTHDYWDKVQVFCCQEPANPAYRG